MPITSNSLVVELSLVSLILSSVYKRAVCGVNIFYRSEMSELENYN